MHARYEVFISSTYVDLATERSSIAQALQAAGYIPTGMEFFPATFGTPIEVIKKTIRESDYYVVVIGSRYGSLARENLSYTEYEYNYAKRIGKKPIAFIYTGDPSADVGGAHVEPESSHKQALLSKFKEKLKNSHNISFASGAELAGRVLSSLNRHVETHPSAGWIRSDTASIIGVNVDEQERKSFYRALRKRAKRKVFIMGVGLTQISMDHAVLWDALEMGISIRLLGISPSYVCDNTRAQIFNEFFNDPIIVADRRPFGYRVQDAHAAILKFIANPRTTNASGHFEYRTYEFFATSNMTAVDADERTGQLVFEHILPGNRRLLYPNVTSKNDAFQKVLGEHEGYWSTASSVASNK